MDDPPALTFSGYRGHRVLRLRQSLHQAGAAAFPMHELRHTAGNEFRRATGDLELIGLYMRHASIATTSEHYMHADKAEVIAGMHRLK